VQIQAKNKLVLEKKECRYDEKEGPNKND